MATAASPPDLRIPSAIAPRFSGVGGRFLIRTSFLITSPMVKTEYPRSLRRLASVVFPEPAIPVMSSSLRLAI